MLRKFIFGSALAWCVVYLAMLSPAQAQQTVTANQGAPSSPSYRGWKTQGTDQAGQAPSGMPVLQGGTDGAAVRTVRTDNTGVLLFEPWINGSAGGSSTNPMYYMGPSTVVTALNAQPAVPFAISTAADASRWKYVSGNLKFGSPQAVSGGTYKLQGSNDSSSPPAWNTWTDISGATVSVTNANDAGGFNVPATAVSYKWIRAVWMSNATLYWRITPVADVAGSLAGRYLLLCGTESLFAASKVAGTRCNCFAPWFRVSGAGSSPGTVAYQGNNYYPVPVDIGTNDSGPAIATTLVTMLTTWMDASARVSSDNGATWTYAASPAAFMSGPRTWVYGNGKYVGVQNGRVWQSTDGTNWDSNTAGAPNMTVFACTYGNSLYVCGATTGGMWSSSDGVSWVTTTVGGQNMPAIAYNGTRFAALANFGTVGAASLDGTVWTTTTITSGTWNDVAWNGSVFVAVAGSGTTAMSSPDGVTWTNRTIPSGAYINVACKPTGPCVASTSASAVAAYTADGITWNAATFSTPFTGPTLVAGQKTLRWDADHSQFVQLDSANPSSLWTSTDGFAWSGTLAPSQSAIANQVVGDSRILGFFSGTTLSATAFLGGSSVIAPMGSASTGLWSAGTTGFTVERINPLAAQTVTGTIVGLY